MTFKQWVLDRYLNKDSARGDFARDTADVSDFPEADDRELILAYLRSKHACYEAIEIFKRMWRDYGKRKTD